MDKNFILETALTNRQAALFYLGQEGFLIKYDDKYILIDPYLSDYVDRNCSSKTVKWVRKYPAPIAAKELDFVDYVLCTHAHFDHSDPDTLRTIAKYNSKATFIVPEPIKESFLSYGITPERLIGALAEHPLKFGNCTIVPIPSAHEELHTDENGHYMELGYKLIVGDISIYHAGDCCVYNGLAEQLMNTDVLMLPVNGRSHFKRYEDDIIGNMTAEEAVILAQKTNSGMLIPMHYDLYAVNCINPAHFVDCLYTINPSQRFHMFVPGERYIINK